MFERSTDGATLSVAVMREERVEVENHTALHATKHWHEFPHFVEHVLRNVDESSFGYILNVSSSGPEDLVFMISQLNEQLLFLLH